jgi:hypothetical protein
MSEKSGYKILKVLGTPRHTLITFTHLHLYLDGPVAGLVGPVVGLDGAGGLDGAMGLDEGAGGFDGFTPACRGEGRKWDHSPTI